MEPSEAEKFFHQGHIYSDNPIVILSSKNIGCTNDFFFKSMRQTLDSAILCLHRDRENKFKENNAEDEYIPHDLTNSSNRNINLNEFYIKK